MSVKPITPDDCSGPMPIPDQIIEIVNAMLREKSGKDEITIAQDRVAHYHIDWAKMNVGAHYGLLPNNSEWFWILLGFDQYLHALTYFFLAWMVL